MAYFLGLDAGNSKTIAVIVNSRGELVGSGRSGCGDISNRQVGSTRALSNVIAAAEHAIVAAGLVPENLKVKAFSMAGADWPEDIKYLQAALDKHAATRSAVIMNDALGALRSASLTGVGVAVVSGTYAVTAARNAAGKSYYSSFWQETGGAYQLGQTALKAVYRAELGLEPPTRLTRAVLAFFGQTEVGAVLHQLTARAANVLDSEIAQLAPLVFEAAEAGDRAALGILEAEAKTLADYVTVAARQVALPDEFTVFLTGGVFRHPSCLLESAVKTRVLQVYPQLDVRRSSTEPVVGALLTAFEQRAEPLTADLFTRLSNLPILAVPESSLYA